MSAEHREHELNRFGSYFLGLPAELARLNTEIRERQRIIYGLEALGEALDREALSRGVLTGDPRLDAAICLSIIRNGGNWIRVSTEVYKSIVEVEKRLKDWEGGIILYDATSEISPYRGELVFGKVSSPRLLIRFREGTKELEKAVTIGVGNYEHLDYFSAGTPVIGFRDGDGVLDTTSLFDPYWGGDSDLRYRIEGPSSTEGLAGLFLGEQEIKRHINEIENNHKLAPQDRALVAEFIARLKVMF